MRVALSAPAVVVALLASSGSAFAQSPANTAFLQCGTPETRGQCASIDMQTGHARVVTFDRSFKEVILGDSEIADVRAQGDRRLAITAKQKPGTTNLILLDDAGLMTHSAAIVVRPQPDAPEPYGRIKIHGVGGSGAAAAAGVAAALAPPGARGAAAAAAAGASKPSIHDYIPYACTSKDCSRLNAERRSEYSKEIFVPGLSAPQTVINAPGASP